MIVLDDKKGHAAFLYEPTDALDHHVTEFIKKNLGEVYYSKSECSQSEVH